jgi:ferric-chelate reductase
MNTYGIHKFHFHVFFCQNLLQLIKWSKTGIANVPGELSLLAGLALWVTTLPRIRRSKFELFFYTHQLYIIFIFLYMLHVGMSAFCQILPGVYLFMIDRYLRFMQSRTRVQLVSARLLPSEGIELNFSKSPGKKFCH